MHPSRLSAASAPSPPADYRVTGSVGMGGIGFSTYLFFESVPDRFLDVDSQAWHYEPGSRDIPIVIPRNYLNLYNFGFARSQGFRRSPRASSAA